MIGVTLFGLMFTPVFFRVIQAMGSLPGFKGPVAASIGSFMRILLAFATLGLSVVAHRAVSRKRGAVGESAGSALGEKQP